MPVIDLLKGKVPDTFSKKSNIWIFLITVFACAALFVFVYHPIGFAQTAKMLPTWNASFYTAVVVGVGFIVFLLARMLLLRRLRRRTMLMWQFLLWVAAEVAAYSLLLTLLAYAINANGAVDFGQLLVRIFFDIVSILAIPYVIYLLVVVLHERERQLQSLRAELEQQDDKTTDNADTLNFFDRGGKLAFGTRRQNVLFVESRDNYSVIHYVSNGNEETYMLHNSLKNVEHLYSQQGLLRCHRCYMVNFDNVKVLRREKDSLLIELTFGGKVIPVSKTYSETVVRLFANLG